MFTEYFSIAARVPASADGERVLTVDELARQFRVSTKTVSRWRRWGLVSRRFLCDGRRRVGFLQSSVDRFVADNAERVRRGARFSRLTDEERHQIIERARCLAQAGESSAGGHQPDCPRDGPQHGDGPLHAQAIRPGAS